MYDGPGVESTALCGFPGEEDALCFLAYTVLPRFHSLISSASLWKTNLNGRIELEMYGVEECALLLFFESLLDSALETFRVIRPSPYHPVLIDLDDSGSLVRFGLLPLQSGVKTPITLPRLED